MGHAKSFCKYSISNSVVREFLAEFLGEYLGYIYSFSIGANFRSINPFSFSGTFMLVVFGSASVAQTVLSLQNYGDFLSINWG